MRHGAHHPVNDDRPVGCERPPHRLLDIMDERLGPEVLLRAVGRRIADEQPMPVDSVRGRLKVAIAVLDELGGLAELEEDDGSLVIRGYRCPLTDVVSGHPEVCRLAEALLTEVVGLPVNVHCGRGEIPRCCFEVAGASDAT